MNDKIAKIKQHVIDHKREYTIAALGVAAVVVAVVVTKKICDSADGVESVDYEVAPKMEFNDAVHDSTITMNNITNIFHERRGHPGNVVRRISDGAEWTSQNLAAQSAGVHPLKMSNHLDGKLPHIKGELYERIGEAAAPVA